MIPKDFFTSPEDKQSSIENIVIMRQHSLPAMPVLSLISRQPLGKTQKKKEFTLRRCIELTTRWIGRPSSLWLASTFLTA